MQKMHEFVCVLCMYMILGKWMGERANDLVGSKKAGKKLDYGFFKVGWK